MYVFLCKYNNFILFKRFFVKKKLSTLFSPTQSIVFEGPMGVYLLGMEGLFYAVCRGCLAGNCVPRNASFCAISRQEWTRLELPAFGIETEMR